MRLSDKIGVIIADETRQYREKNLNSLTAPTLGSLNVGWANPAGLLLPQSRPGYVKSPNADRLLRLHAMQDEQGKAEFVKHMRANTFGNDRSHLSFLVLHRLGLTHEAVVLAVKSKQPRGMSGFESAMSVLAALLAGEYSTMSAEWCQRVKVALGPELPRLTIVRDRLDQILLRHIDAELVDANPEIYADRDKVVSIWERNFGDKNVANLVDEIDQYFRDGERSETAFATCLGRLRVLIASVCRAAVDRAAEAGKAPLRVDADEKTVLQHLVSIEVASKPIFNILRSLRDLAATEGAHALEARIEDARLVKNMTYEVLLLLLTKTPGVKP